jgi:hypothetical protein
MKRHPVKLLASVCAAITIFWCVALLTTTTARGEGKAMPDTIVIKYLMNQYGPVTFNHAMHASLANGCGTCHHQHNEKINAGCRECHALSAHAFKASVTRGFGACSSCHSEASPEMPEMPGLKTALHKKCFACHTGIGELGSSPEGCVKTCHVKRMSSAR